MIAELTESDLDRLVELARAALTVGDGWAAVEMPNDEGGNVYAKRDNHTWTVADCDYFPHAAFIAAADPVVVVALVERLRAAEGAVARVRALAEGGNRCVGEVIDAEWAEDFEKDFGFGPYAHYPTGYAPGCDGCSVAQSADYDARLIREALDGPVAPTKGQVTLGAADEPVGAQNGSTGAREAG